MAMITCYYILFLNKLSDITFEFNYIYIYIFKYNSPKKCLVLKICIFYQLLKTNKFNI